MLRIAVCDDEPQIVKQLTDLVMQCAPDCELTCYAHGEELLEAQKTFDLIFLDIQMKPLNGMETAKRIRSLDEGVLIVFITAWKEYVFDAFDVGAFHYLLKPVQLQKLREILQRAQRETDRKNHAKKQQLFLKTRERSFVVNVEDILFLENALRKVVIHTDAQTILVYGTMSEFEKKLGAGFYRSHRGYLVNLARIAEYDAETIYMDNGETAYLTKKNYPDFVKCYMRFLRNGREQDD